MDRAPLGLPSDWKGSAPTSAWAIGVILAGLLVAGLPARAVRADAILNSGTATISSGTWMNDAPLLVGGTGTLTVTGGSVTSTDLRVGAGGSATGTLAISAGSIVNTNATLGSSAGFISVVPEPSTYAMALAGLACGGWQMFRRRRLRQAPLLVERVG